MAQGTVRWFKRDKALQLYREWVSGGNDESAQALQADLPMEAKVDPTIVRDVVSGATGMENVSQEGVTG